jgi:hypothetical protein
MIPVRGARSLAASTHTTNTAVWSLLTFFFAVQRRGPIRVYSYDEDPMRCKLGLYFELREESQVPRNIIHHRLCAMART